MGRTFACSDLHGMKELYNQICNFLEPDDRVYFLGDAADRGPDGWELIKTIMVNPQWTYLMGNHEEMLYNAMYNMKDENPWADDVQLLYQNGGYQTLEDWMNEGGNLAWANKLRNLPMFVSYLNAEGKTVWLSHAGFTPGVGGQLVACGRNFVWNREHFFRWLEGYDNMICVHGHTPIPILAKRINTNPEEGALWYCGGHKVCIDNASFATGITCLFDLDTYDEHIFQIPNFNKS